jgi:hypothetical protein
LPGERASKQCIHTAATHTYALWEIQWKGGKWHLPMLQLHKRNAGELSLAISHPPSQPKNMHARWSYTWTAKINL